MSIINTTMHYTPLSFAASWLNSQPVSQQPHYEFTLQMNKKQNWNVIIFAVVLISFCMFCIWNCNMTKVCMVGCWVWLGPECLASVSVCVCCCVCGLRFYVLDITHSFTVRFLRGYYHKWGVRERILSLLSFLCHPSLFFR